MLAHARRHPRDLGIAPEEPPGVALLERGEPCWNMYSPGELVLKKDIAGIRARNQIWMAKARELNLLRT